MTTFKTLLMVAALATPATLIATHAQAQVAGIAVVDPDAAVGNSNAWKNAQTQLQTTYKTQIDQAEARRKAITAELQPLVAKFQADQKAKVPAATLQAQATSLQTKEQAGNAELQRLTAPFLRARAYVAEQIQAQLKAAVDAAAARKKASIVLTPSAVVHLDPAGDITGDVTTELNRLVPSANITPPAGWEPGQQGGAPAAAPAPAPAPTKPQPQGR